MITEHNHHDTHHVQTADRPPATIEAERLAGFVRTQTASATPQRIVESLTTLVSTEVLTEGTRLPTVRALAETLHVSPATCVLSPISPTKNEVATVSTGP